MNRYIFENESRGFNMKYLKQFSVIILICLVGELIVSFLPFGFSGNVMAMILLAGLLACRVVKEKHIKEVSDFLLEVISLFIVPVSVGMVAYFELIRSVWLQLLLISLITLVLTFASCAFTIRLTMKLINCKKEREA